MSERAKRFFGDLVPEKTIAEICSEVAEDLQFNAAEMMIPYEESEKEVVDGLCDADGFTACRADNMYSGSMDVDCPAR